MEVLQFWENGPLSFAIVVAATHDTSYRNDAGGIKSSRRWLSEATPSGYEMGVKAAGTPAGVQDLMLRCRPVVSSLTLHNHRLLIGVGRVSPPPPSEPYGRISRIRLSSWWFYLDED